MFLPKRGTKRRVDKSPRRKRKKGVKRTKKGLVSPSVIYRQEENRDPYTYATKDSGILREEEFRQGLRKEEFRQGDSRKVELERGGLRKEEFRTSLASLQRTELKIFRSEEYRSSQKVQKLNIGQKDMRQSKHGKTRSRLVVPKGKSKKRRKKKAKSYKAKSERIVVLKRNISQAEIPTKREKTKMESLDSDNPWESDEEMQSQSTLRSEELSGKDELFFKQEITGQDLEIEIKKEDIRNAERTKHEDIRNAERTKHEDVRTAKLTKQEYVRNFRHTKQEEIAEENDDPWASDAEEKPPVVIVCEENDDPWAEENDDPWASDDEPSPVQQMSKTTQMTQNSTTPGLQPPNFSNGRRKVIPRLKDGRRKYSKSIRSWTIKELDMFFLVAARDGFNLENISQFLPSKDRNAVKNKRRSLNREEEINDRQDFKALCKLTNRELTSRIEELLPELKKK